MNLSKSVQLLGPRAWLVGEDFDAAKAFVSTLRHRQLGWHYIVDLAWIYAQAKTWPHGIRVLDVGGGAGPAQFMLAEMGFYVTNIDLVPPRLTGWMKRRYASECFISASYSETDYVGHLQRQVGLWKSLRFLDDAAALGRIRDRVSGAVAEKHYNDWRRRHSIHLPVGTLHS